MHTSAHAVHEENPSLPHLKRKRWEGKRQPRQAMSPGYMSQNCCAPHTKGMLVLSNLMRSPLFLKLVWKIHPILQVCQPQHLPSASSLRVHLSSLSLSLMLVLNNTVPIQTLRDATCHQCPSVDCEPLPSQPSAAFINPQHLSPPIKSTSLWFREKDVVRVSMSKALQKSSEMPSAACPCALAQSLHQRRTLGRSMLAASIIFLLAYRYL